MATIDRRTIYMAIIDRRTIYMASNDRRTIYMAINDRRTIYMAINDRRVICMAINDLNDRLVISFVLHCMYHHHHGSRCLDGQWGCISTIRCLGGHGGSISSSLYYSWLTVPSRGIKHTSGGPGLTGKEGVIANEWVGGHAVGGTPMG